MDGLAVVLIIHPIEAYFAELREATTRKINQSFAARATFSANGINTLFQVHHFVYHDDDDDDAMDEWMWIENCGAQSETIPFRRFIAFKGVVLFLRDQNCWSVGGGEHFVCFFSPGSLVSRVQINRNINDDRRSEMQ